MTTMTHRGTTNRNDRGSSTSRRRRREWLVTTYRADRDVLMGGEGCEDEVIACVPASAGRGELYGDGWRWACRCYRCGDLLTVDTVTADRIKPGCQGGTYARHNIRPACGTCNSSTGGALGNQRRRAAS